MNKPLGHTLLGSIFKNTKYKNVKKVDSSELRTQSNQTAEKKVKNFESAKKADS